MGVLPIIYMSSLFCLADIISACSGSLIFRHQTARGAGRGRRPRATIAPWLRPPLTARKQLLRATNVRAT